MGDRNILFFEEDPGAHLRAHLQAAVAAFGCNTSGG